MKAFYVEIKSLKTLKGDNSGAIQDSRFVISNFITF